MHKWLAVHYRAQNKLKIILAIGQNWRFWVFALFILFDYLNITKAQKENNKKRDLLLGPDQESLSLVNAVIVVYGEGEGCVHPV